MTQRELNHAVADVTGESLRTIAGMGFSLIEPLDEDPDGDVNRVPLTVDWDEIDSQRRAA